MFEYPDVSRLDASAALDVLEQARLERRRMEVTEALAMLRVVHSYRHEVAVDKVRLGGEGTGLIDDFACLELAAALRRSTESVTAEAIELLDLEARLPQLWDCVLGCGVPLWQARRLARLTHELTLRKVLWVDATIAPFLTRLAFSRLTRFVEALVVQADPAAAEARWASRHSRRVSFGPNEKDGLRDLYACLDAADAIYLDAALNQLSEILGRQGSTENADARRATALGILATPARALALIQQSLSQPVLDEAPDAEVGPEAGHGPRSPIGCSGHHCGTISVNPDRLLPRATLVIHLSDETVITGTGLGRCDQLGPVTISQLRLLVGHSRVQVQPVFNPDGQMPVDSYEIPAALRRAVLARHPYEVFPYGAHSSAGLDLDHTVPYRWGERWSAGQTRLGNLGPLRRRAHRAKTHARWRLSQAEPGWFAWTTPLGRRYVITPSGLTNDYRHVPGNHPWDNPHGGPLLPEPPPAGSQRSRRRGRTSNRAKGSGRGRAAKPGYVSRP